MIGVPLSIYIGKSFAISGKETNALRRIVFLYNKNHACYIDIEM